jgi:hypothetical protein
MKKESHNFIKINENEEKPLQKSINLDSNIINLAMQ